MAKDDFEKVRSILERLSDAATGEARVTMDLALDALDRIRARYRRASRELSDATGMVATMRYDLLELEKRNRANELNLSAAKREVEKARADGYEEGFSDGIRFRREGCLADGKGHDAR